MTRDNSNASPHALVASISSPGRPAIQIVIGHAPHPLSPYRFQSSCVFPKHAPPTTVYPLLISRLVPRLVLPRLDGRLVPISACSLIPYSLYRPTGSCSSGLAPAPVSSPPISNMKSPSPYPHRPIYPSYSRILVFLYLLYTSHTSYSLYTSIDEPRRTTPRQPSSRRPASRPAASNRESRYETRA